MTTTQTTPAGNGIQRQASDSPARRFRNTATKIAGALLREWVGEERAGEATGRIAAALSASAASARDPRDFYACTPESVATCVAVSALTGIMPGVGSTALAYVVPQRARAGEDPQLQYNLSHRGINALARRCGQTMVAIPVGMNDRLDSDPESGEVLLTYRDIDNPPLTFDELRGVIVAVKELGSGRTVCREFVPKTLIEKRRAMSRSFNGRAAQYSPWTNWPVEMAMKTALHYAIGRGWCVIDDTSAARALTADVEADLQPARLPAPETAGSRSDQVAALLGGEESTTTTTDGTEDDSTQEGSTDAEAPQDDPAVTEEATDEQPPEGAEATGDGHEDAETTSSGSGAEGTAPESSLLPDEPLRRKPGEAVHAWSARVSEAIKATNDPAELKDIERFLNAERDAGRVMKPPHENLMRDISKREGALNKN